MGPNFCSQYATSLSFLKLPASFLHNLPLLLPSLGVPCFHRSLSDIRPIYASYTLTYTPDTSKATYTLAMRRIYAAIRKAIRGIYAELLRHKMYAGETPGDAGFWHRHIWYHRVPYGTIRYPMVPYGTVWYHIVPYATICYHMVPYGIIWYHMVPYGAIWCHTEPCWP